MDIRHTANLLSLVLGMIGSLYLSYDLFGNKGGILRRSIVGVTTGIIASLIVFISITISYNLSHNIIPTYIYFLPPVMFVFSFFMGFYLGDNDYSDIHTVMSIKSYFVGKDSYPYWAFFAITLIFYIVTSIFYLPSWKALLSSAIIFPGCIAIVLTLPVVARASTWAFKTDQKRLGAIGALLTFGAFTFQFWLAATS